MSDYPTLSEMGVQNPDQIDRYSLQTINNIDLLRIVYKRKKGSILPDSKRFRFPRTEKLVPGDGSSRDSQVFYEVAPVVRQVMAELDKIVVGKRKRVNQIEMIREEIEKLEEETSHQIVHIKELLAELS